MNRRKPTRILSLPEKVQIGRNYHLQFKTDVGIMVSTEIIAACGLTRNEFYHRGKRKGGTGWLDRDILLNKEEKAKKVERERNAVSGNFKMNLDEDKSIPVDLRVEIREERERKRMTAVDLKNRDDDYRRALRSTYAAGGMNRLCNKGIVGFNPANMG